MSSQYEAPHVNGVMDLSETDKTKLKGQLKTIIDGFVSTYEQPEITTHYIVATHLKKHGAQATFTAINGDTAEALLAELSTEEGE